MEISSNTEVTAIWKEMHPQVSEFSVSGIPGVYKYSSKLNTFFHSAVICILEFNFSSQSNNFAQV